MSQHFWGLVFKKSDWKVINDAPPLLFLDHVHLDTQMTPLLISCSHLVHSEKQKPCGHSRYQPCFYHLK